MTDRIVVDGRFSDEPAKVVWKWEIPMRTHPMSRQIPVGSRLLHVDFVDSFGQYMFLLWYEVELAKKDQMLTHVYQMFPTGDDSIPHSAKHIGTGISWNEDHRDRRTTPNQVWHLFEFPSGARVVDA